ncbi:hypothetical protein LEQ06_07985 [Paraclostridium sp. AKS46]|nr:hypothetical protein [Paraclostridium sp. AKS46]
MFTIDFTKPWLYKDIIYFNQGNLSTNNTLRCKLVTGGSDDFTGGSIACTFTTKDSIEISGFGRLVDAKGGIVDIVFPSNALVVGTNKLEVLVNRADGGVAQSPPVMYDIWQGLTTGNGIEAETNYPILIELINSTNEASNKANSAFNKVNSMITDITDAIDNAYRSANDADIATSNANTKIEEVENAKVGMINKVDTEIANMKTQVNASTNTMTSKVDMKIADVDSAISSGTKDLEVKESRRDMDGVEHDTLKLRLESDLKKGKVIEETKEGTYLSFNDTVGGLVSYLEVLGNTVQDVTNLANIISSCIPNGDGTFKMSILSCGENLIPSQNLVINKYYDNNGNMVVSDNDVCDTNYYRINSNSVTLSRKSGNIKKPIKILTYNKDKVFIQRFQSTSLADDAYSVSFNSDVKYIRIGHSINDYDLKLQEGTVATPYTAYQETRCDIKLPCQLEKWDKLYFDKEENAWVVDKKTFKTPFVPTEIFNGVNVRLARMRKVEGMQTVIGKMISNRFVEHNSAIFDKAEYINKFCTLINANYVDVILDCNLHNTLDKAKEYLKDMYVIYESTNPQKIVLPQSEQIKLNSFANKTHIYTISGDVDATVKATVSKSLASTVQANTEEISKINNTIADIQGLKESQDFEYETDKGYLVCKDTQNGVVKDLKLSGRSLVNLIKSKVALPFTKTYTATDSSYISISEFGSTFVIGDYFTFVYDVDVTQFDPSNTGISRVFLQPKITYSDGYVAYKTLQEIKQIGNLSINTFVGCKRDGVSISKIEMGVGASHCTCTVKINSVMLFSSDESQNKLTHFEGIASVGNGNEIEVLSRKEDGNLFDINKFAITSGSGTIDILNGTYSTQANTNNHARIKINVEPNTKYICDCDSGNKPFQFRFRDENQSMITSLTSPRGVNRNYEINTGNNKVIYFELFHSELDSGFSITFSNIYFGKSSGFNGYEPMKQDKKPILFKDADNTWKPVTNLRGIDENNCDVIENESIKIKTIESTINGLENIIIADDTLPNTTMFAIQNYFTNNLIGLQGVGICNSLPYKNIYSKDEVGIFATSSNGTVYIRVNKKSLESFKNEIKLNNIVFITTLNKEKVYEINPIFPNSYENETMISFGSGSIAPHASWKITSSLPNFVQNIEDRVCRLENDAYKVNLANFTVALNMLDMKARLESLEAPIN